MKEKKTKQERTNGEQELTPEQYHILREKGTEAPFSGKLLYNTEKGMYVCAACGNELFSSDTKFDAGCGWPSFSNVLEDKIILQEDHRSGMTRREVLCKKCGGHLGHLFDDGPKPTGLRYCINSVSLGFKKKIVKKKRLKVSFLPLVSSY